jgi:hypothetical protein
MLHRSANDPSYTVIDGDLPCTTKVSSVFYVSFSFLCSHSSFNPIFLKLIQVEQNFTYMFNVCGAVPSGIPDKCKALAGSNSAGAVQINTRGTYDASDDYCYLVGTYSESSTKVQLLDQLDPTKGIKVSYYGSYCADSTQRQFNIEVGCADKLNPVATHALEYSHCVYTITMPSVYGCPLECPVSNRHLCAGNGHCAYDDDKGGARCFCNTGMSFSLLIYLNWLLFSPKVSSFCFFFRFQATPEATVPSPPATARSTILPPCWASSSPCSS